MELKGKLARYIDKGVEFLGLIKDESHIMPLDISNNMNEFIVNFTRFSKVLNTQNPLISLSDVRLLAPIKSPLQDVICLGINYMEHAVESMKFKKENFDGKREEAVYFGKRVNEFSASGDTFCNTNLTKQLDYEVELAVIIGTDARNVSENDTHSHIFGYSIMNDISARDLQLKHKQWYAGKSLEGACPLGPFIVLRDSIDVTNLNIRSYVNGELRQNSNTSKMIFGINYVISELSHYFTLKAGSIISMGTPSGVGMGFNPPKFLQSGDVVKCEIENIGEIVTYIK
ncbi:fumarylacetoacetase [Helicobacter saguini]|uniref:FAA hydrolase family protein n=1 Tax=Helicobacter saguini TaxID=1548018 RepID=A0A347VTJ6_9HELI|nr:fumarylacetoacetate hydrolase family protein [Helicobacter saguini]MWV62068.1 fumarylacetoacetase [Helicobacter saguini]MWV67258.1 fumarylacetoacetase [Helicobacter saguini]MWV69612.1 fumarylacetoacetase [Helicobacter saguini]MWV70838.1 fumarylacetoacetase [Helicobacter saguini]TLD94324.1 FAA hydrolase family protein [Helicobacter saguini]